MSLDAQRSELEQLGFRIVEQSGGSLIAIIKKFHWDCVLTRLSYVVFVRELAELTPAVIEADRQDLEQRTRQLDPSILPRGLQKGTAVIVAYLAERVSPEARELCESNPKVRFAYFYLPAARDGATGLVHYLKTTPAWGAIYFSKLRFVIQKVLTPGQGGSTWPVSIGGAVLTLIITVVLVMNVAIFLSR
jgi:hypothetical protein